MESELQACVNIFANWLTDISLGTWLKYLYWAGGLIIVWLAFLTLKVRTSQAKATFLLKLSIRFGEMDKARNAVGNVKKYIMGKVKDDYGHLEENEKEKILRKLYCEEIKKIRAGTHTKYTQQDYKNIIKLCGFLEIVGLMVKRKYVPIEDIIEWIKGPIEDFDVMFSGHIAERQKEFGTPPGLFENALWLAIETKKKDKQKRKKPVGSGN